MRSIICLISCKDKEGVISKITDFIQIEEKMKKVLQRVKLEPVTIWSSESALVSMAIVVC